MDYESTQPKDFSYSFCLTKDLNTPLTVRISVLEGIREKKPFTTLLDDPTLKFTGVQTNDFSDLYVTCQLYADNKPLTIPIRTSYKSFKNHWLWNEWLTIPIKFCDLPITAQLVFTVWDIYGPRKAVPVGGTTFRLFGKHNKLRKGKHKLYLWPDVEADGRDHTTTPSKIGEVDEMDRLEKLVKRYDRNDITRLDWLDNLAFRQIEKIHKEESSKSKKLYLYIDLPKFDDFPIVFSEPEYPLPVAPTPPVNGQTQPALLTSSSESNMVLIVDPEINRENPVEGKHRRLVRSHRNGPLDRDLKPDAKTRDELNGILKYPPTKPLTEKEKDLLWNFRFYLTRDKKALTKFLKCVAWSDSTEAKQAVELLPKWVDIDLDDALELLGANFKDRSVRGYAVSQLKKADDDELLLYLLQLVQALKFENISDKSSSSSLAEFLIERAIKNPILGNNFHWYLMVECEDGNKTVSKMYGKVDYRFMTEMTKIDQRREILRRQGELVQNLSSLSKEIRNMKDTRPKKIERLRAIISDPKNGLLQFPPLPLPLDARIEVTGIIPEKTSVFKSNLFPLRLTFSLADGGEYPVMFKTGDDLPHHPEEKAVGTYGVSPAVMDTYVKSCAGYCVITYLLGVGDRHLDNLLLSPEGNLFHVDFGFILGRDPKPFPPPMKLCKEMVEAMGCLEGPREI
ncbi:unnamed protein product [Rhizophagus irregularis]|nr:unnamed protein product [Rhizophagus irregularis]